MYCTSLGPTPNFRHGSEASTVTTHTILIVFINYNLFENEIGST